MEHAAEEAKAARTRQTQFLYACSAGDLSAVEQLVERGCDASCHDSRLACGLHLAASRGHADVLSFLLQHGQDVDAEDESGRTGASPPQSVRRD